MLRLVQVAATAVAAVEADALGALHASGICHRDLKPTNVMFREPDSPVLIDFGLARDLHFAAVLTGRGEIFGTPYYMSPEQGHGQPADHRSDIYSLGIMFFEMLSGRRPYDGDTAELTIYVTEGGVFDAAEPATTTDPDGDGSLTLKFSDCTSGVVTYEIDSLGLAGEIAVQRIDEVDAHQDLDGVVVSAGVCEHARQALEPDR